MREQRSVFVTGSGSPGIGLATVELLSSEGFRVFAGVRPGGDSSVLAEIDCEIIPLDVTCADSLAQARRCVSERLDGAPLWGLVNNAGVVSAGPVEFHDIAAARHVLEVNFLGVLATSQTFLPLIRAAGGRIVNISSLSGLLAMPFMAPYCASKAAVESLSDSMRRELQPLGVDVIVVQPGTTRSPMWKTAEAIDLTSLKGTVYEKVTCKVMAMALKKGRNGQSPQRVAAAILHGLEATPAPTRIRVQRKRSSGFFYSLLPFVPDRVIDRKIKQRIWGK